MADSDGLKDMIGAFFSELGTELLRIFATNDGRAHKIKEHLSAPHDRQHLNTDIERVYELMLVQWMDYMQHLRRCYLHLFSLADRTNPFNLETSVEVK